MAEEYMKLEQIRESKECIGCNCFEDCLKAAGTKKWKVEKDMSNCCTTTLRN